MKRAIVGAIVVALVVVVVDANRGIANWRIPRLGQVPGCFYKNPCSIAVC